MQTGNCTFTTLPVPKGNLCTDVYCDPNVGIVTTATACPSSCGSCDPSSGCTSCSSSLSPSDVAGISAGVIAAVIIACLAFAAILAYGGKRGYDYWKSRAEGVGKVHDNPLYENKGGFVENQIFEKTND